MATKYLTFSGRAKWCKNHKPDDKYKNYTIDVYMDQSNLEKLKASGLTLTPKTDDEGTYVRFRRPEKKVIKDELVKFGPPKAVDKDNQEFNEAIGNGSEVEVDVVVYDAGQYVGHRWNQVKVLNHVPYERKELGNEPLPVTKGNNAGATAPRMPF